MKLVFIVHKFDYKNRGGVLKVVTLLSNEFIKKHQVEIISLGGVVCYPYDIDSRITVKSLNLKKYDTRYYRGIFKIIWFLNVFIFFMFRKNDGILLTTSPPLNYVFSFIKFFKRKIKVVGCDHTAATYKSNGLNGVLKFYLYRKLDAFISLTKDDSSFFARHNVNSKYIPNPIEDIKYDEDQNLRSRLLYVGRFSKEKRPLLALEAYYASRLYERGIYFYMYGYGEEYENILNKISQYSLNDFVFVITDESDPKIIYKDAFALVLTSEVEGFGMVLIEAISRNIPCVAFDAPYGPRNIIVNNLNGFLVSKVEDIHSFLNINLINNLHNKDIKKTIDEFKISNVMKLWQDIFDDL